MPDFVLGFREVAERLGSGVVGEPLEDEQRVSPSVAVQFTRKGVMVYSAVANRAGFVAFTERGDQVRAAATGDPISLVDRLPVEPRNELETRLAAEIRLIAVHWSGGRIRRDMIRCWHTQERRATTSPGTGMAGPAGTG